MNKGIIMGSVAAVVLAAGTASYMGLSANGAPGNGKLSASAKPSTSVSIKTTTTRPSSSTSPTKSKTSSSKTPTSKTSRSSTPKSSSSPTSSSQHGGYNPHNPSATYALYHGSGPKLPTLASGSYSQWVVPNGYEILAPHLWYSLAPTSDKYALTAEQFITASWTEDGPVAAKLLSPQMFSSVWSYLDRVGSVPAGNPSNTQIYWVKIMHVAAGAPAPHGPANSGQYQTYWLTLQWKYSIASPVTSAGLLGGNTPHIYQSPSIGVIVNKQLNQVVTFYYPTGVKYTLIK